VARVFISSTCYDLVDLRAEVEDHVRSLGLQPVTSDSALSDFAVEPDRHSIDTCLVNVRSSSVFVCILSQRYGPALPRYGHPDHSATHVEYLEAKKAGIPIQFYVRDRLAGEFSSWRAATKEHPFVTTWVPKDKRGGEDHRIFEFIKSHQEPPSVTGVSNWTDSFKDSLELKRILSNRLKAQSRPALLTRLVEAGRVPFLTMTLVRLSHDSLHSLGEVDIRAAGSCSAIGIELSGDIGDGRKFGPTNVGDLSHGQACRQRLHFPLVTDDRPNPTTNVRLSYQTEYGHAIADTYSVTLWGRATDIRVEARLVTRELQDDIRYEVR
jgi:hypothetical protein